MKFIKIIFLFALMYLAKTSLAQCVQDSTFLGSDTTVCNGQSLTLTGLSGLSHLWSTTDSVATISVNTPGSYWCTVTTPDSTNLILNGDFSLGDTLFSSAHVYGTGGSWGLLSSAGQYAISTNANLTHNNFPNCADHTTGTGNYMIVNGSTTANLSVWCQTISVNPNTSYVFSAWLTSVVSGSPAVLSFTADGVSMGPNVNLTSTTCFWQNFYQIWTSGPTQTSVSICLTNQNTQGGGNDFGLDDLYFAEICTNTDTINVTHAGPTVNLGPDTTICAGDSITLDATNPAPAVYLWSDGDTNSTKTLTSSQTNFAVTVTQYGCTDTDNFNLSILNPPVVQLSNDTTLCSGASIFETMIAPQASYLWSTGSTSQGIFLNQDTTYWGQATNMCGVDADTVSVSLVSPLQPNLGNDTIVCGSSTFNLSTPLVADVYLWNTGSQTNTTVVGLPQTYILTVTNICGSYIDSIHVDYQQAPTVNLGPDHDGCISNLVTYDVTINGPASYQWSTGITTPQLTAMTAGSYWVSISNYCGVATDTVNVAYDSPIYFYLGLDIINCLGDTETLAPFAPNASFVWSDGSTDSTLVTTTFGTFWVRASNNCGTFSDSINIFSESPPQISSPVPDTTLCDGQIYSVSVYQGNASFILWSDGSSLWNNDFLTAGTYHYTVQNFCGVDSDTFTYTMETPAVFSLGSDTIICAGEVIEKSFSFPNHTYLWSDGLTDSTRQIRDPGVYALTISTPVGCESDDAFHVKLCPTQLFIPNAFTPQTGDELNNVFKAEGVGTFRYHMAIYDRWGFLVFETHDFQKGWDGTVNGKPCEPGYYSYKIWYNTGEDSESVSRVGSVKLLR